MEDPHAKLVEAIQKNMREDDTITPAPQGLTINLNFYGQMDVGTLTAVKLIVQALKASQPELPQVAARPLKSV